MPFPTPCSPPPSLLPRSSSGSSCGGAAMLCSACILGIRPLRDGLRSYPPAVDPHFVGAGLRHRSPYRRLPGVDLGRDHGGTADATAADPGAADTHATSASLCGT